MTDPQCKVAVNIKWVVSELQCLTNYFNIIVSLTVSIAFFSFLGKQLDEGKTSWHSSKN